MKSLKFKIMIFPALPLATSAMHHYFPEWISAEAWAFSSLFGVIAMGALIIIDFIEMGKRK